MVLIWYIFTKFIEFINTKWIFYRYLQFFYRTVRLFCTVLVNDTGNGPISTHDAVKFINFRSINYRFEKKSYYCRILIVVVVVSWLVNTKLELLVNTLVKFKILKWAYHVMFATKEIKFYLCNYLMLRAVHLSTLCFRHFIYLPNIQWFGA